MGDPVPVAGDGPEGVVHADRRIREVLDLTRAMGISGVPVVSEDQTVGIVTGRDLRFETQLDAPVSSVMTPQERLVTVTEGADEEEVVSLLHQHRIEKVLVVGDNFELKGMITAKDFQKAKDFPRACKDSSGALRVGAAVGTGYDSDDRVAALVTAGVDVLVVDTSHGYSKGVLNRITRIKQQYPDMQVIGGNIVTADAAEALVEAGHAQIEELVRLLALVGGLARLLARAHPRAGAHRPASVRNGIRGSHPVAPGQDRTG